jgi:nitroreductase
MTTPSATAISTTSALPDHPMHTRLSKRWSPDGFSDRAVTEADLRSLFEAARWAASSYNEQPWSFIVATRDETAAFARLLTSLVPANQVRAANAPVLVLGIVRLNFAKTEADNRAAIHDLGLATASLTFEATAGHLSVHPMIGIVPERARELYQIPEHSEAFMALAIGYASDTSHLSDDLRERDLAQMQRKSTRKFVFSSVWGRPSVLTRPESPSP